MRVYGGVRHMLMCRVQGWPNRTLQFLLSSLLSKGSERQAGHKAETDNTQSFVTSAFHFNLKARKKKNPHLTERDQVSLLSTILQLSSFSLYSINTSFFTFSLPIKSVYHKRIFFFQYISQPDLLRAHLRCLHVLISPNTSSGVGAPWLLHISHIRTSASINH